MTSLVWTAWMACTPGPGPDDTATEGEQQCWDDALEGTCPGERICQQGRCILPVDPGTPAPDLDTRLAEWDTIWSSIDGRYAAFDAKPDLDWLAVRDQVAADLEDVETELEAIHRMSLGIAEIGDGHTYLWHATCSSLALPPRGYSNIGACFVEGEDGQVLVNGTSDALAMDLQLGDVLLSVDGRPSEYLLADAWAQPGCTIVGSTPEMTRSVALQSLGWREEAESSLEVQRDGQILEVDLVRTDAFLACDGRTAPPVEALPAGVEWARLDGDIGYLYFPFFGSTDRSGDFVDTLINETLREVLEDNADIQGLVLDLRANGGGYPSVYAALASVLYDEPTTLFYGAGLGLAGQDAPFIVQPDPTLQLDVPIAVLVSPRSFSAADFMSGFLSETGRGRLFGRASGGGFGSGDGVSENPYFVGINTYPALNLAKEPYEGNPPPVDQQVWPQAQDLAAGQDTVLNAALLWLDGEI